MVACRNLKIFFNFDKTKYKLNKKKMALPIRYIDNLLRNPLSKKLKIPNELNGYSIDKVIFENENGTVIVSAKDKDNKEVAIKCIPIKIKLDLKPSSIQELHHKNIIKYINYFSYPEKNTRFHAIVMDKGYTDLMFYIVNTTLDEKMIWNIMRQLFDGVKYLHSRSIWHRNLKPENILEMNETSKESLIVISGFGSAIEVKTDTYHGDGKGTIIYAAPELLERNGGSIEFKENIDCMYFTKKSIKNFYKTF